MFQCSNIENNKSVFNIDLAQNLQNVAEGNQNIFIRSVTVFNEHFTISNC